MQTITFTSRTPRIRKPSYVDQAAKSFIDNNDIKISSIEKKLKYMDDGSVETFTTITFDEEKTDEKELCEA